MFAQPRFILFILLIVAGWYVIRRWNRHVATIAGRQRAPSRRPAAAPRTVEDLVACRICGSYVAAGARRCGNPGCPQPL